MIPQHLELFPHISWFLNAFHNNGVFLEQNPRFLQNKFINKFVIPGPNQLQILTIPLISTSKLGSFDDIQIDYSQKWIREHKNALQTAYGKSPFFEYYDYRIFEIYDNQPEKLASLNLTLLQNMLKWIGLAHLPINAIENENAIFFDVLKNNILIPEYNQVFHEKFGFRGNVSILDLLFNQGPLSKEYFQNTF